MLAWLCVCVAGAPTTASHTATPGGSALRAHAKVPRSNAALANVTQGVSTNRSHLPAAVPALAARCRAPAAAAAQPRTCELNLTAVASVGVDVRLLTDIVQWHERMIPVQGLRTKDVRNEKYEFSGQLTRARVACTRRSTTFAHVCVTPRFVFKRLGAWPQYLHEKQMFCLLRGVKHVQQLLLHDDSCQVRMCTCTCEVCACVRYACARVSRLGRPHHRLLVTCRCTCYTCICTWQAPAPADSSASHSSVCRPAGRFW